ncbi:MAG TPA: hypothetical protein VGK73_28210, partial [Polyangiaceae bacterium]
FTSQTGSGTSDIWRATRAHPSGLFGEPALVSELNVSGLDDVPSFISEDGCRLYFDRTPNAWSSLNGNVYVAEREAIDE